MIAVSSHKPFQKSRDVAANQIRAKLSWELVFSEIIYFGDPEYGLKSDKTSFIPCEDYPPIVDMANECASHPGWSCIINADILLSPSVRSVEMALNARRAQAAISKRFEIDSNLRMADAIVVDWGLDIFIATQRMWQAAARAVPKEFRIGHNRWDTWMLSFLVSESRGAIADLTPSRLVFHPKHGDRAQPHRIEIPIDEPFLNDVKWPGLAIKIWD